MKSIERGGSWIGGAGPGYNLPVPTLEPDMRRKAARRSIIAIACSLAAAASAAPLPAPEPVPAEGANPASGPPAPRLLAARPEDGRATIRFSPVEGASFYRVRVIGPDGEERRIDRVETADYTVQGLENGRACRFTVSAVAGDREGPASAALEARP